MKSSVLWIPMVALAGLPALSFDFSSIPVDSPEELKAAVENAGGAVSGSPTIIEGTGPDGATERLLFFPDFQSSILVPVEIQTNSFHVHGAINAEQMPFRQSAGPLYGIMFGAAIDYVIGLGADKWSSVATPFVQSGGSILIPNTEIAEANVFSNGGWVAIAFSASSGTWTAKLGPEFQKSGDIETDSRNPVRTTPRDLPADRRICRSRHLAKDFRLVAAC